ncbi:MAG: hypothetical protein RL226_1466 [Bacteroidota bacterium]
MRSTKIKKRSQATFLSIQLFWLRAMVSRIRSTNLTLSSIVLTFLSIFLDACILLKDKKVACDGLYEGS